MECDGGSQCGPHTAAENAGDDSNRQRLDRPASQGRSNPDDPTRTDRSWNRCSNAYALALPVRSSAVEGARSVAIAQTRKPTRRKSADRRFGSCAEGPRDIRGEGQDRLTLNLIEC